MYAFQCGRFQGPQDYVGSLLQRHRDEERSRQLHVPALPCAATALAVSYPAPAAPCKQEGVPNAVLGLSSVWRTSDTAEDTKLVWRPSKAASRALKTLLQPQLSADDQARSLARELCRDFSTTPQRDVCSAQPPACTTRQSASPLPMPYLPELAPPGMGVMSQVQRCKDALQVQHWEEQGEAVARAETEASERLLAAALAVSSRLPDQRPGAAAHFFDLAGTADCRGASAAPAPRAGGEGSAGDAAHQRARQLSDLLPPPPPGADSAAVRRLPMPILRQCRRPAPAAQAAAAQAQSALCVLGASEYGKADETIGQCSETEPVPCDFTGQSARAAVDSILQVSIRPTDPSTTRVAARFFSGGYSVSNRDLPTAYTAAQLASLLGTAGAATPSGVACMVKRRAWRLAGASINQPGAPAESSDQAGKDPVQPHKQRSSQTSAQAAVVRCAAAAVSSDGCAQGQEPTAFAGPAASPAAAEPGPGPPAAVVLAERHHAWPNPPASVVSGSQPNTDPDSRRESTAQPAPSQAPGSPAVPGAGSRMSGCSSGAQMPAEAPQRGPADRSRGHGVNQADADPSRADAEQRPAASAAAGVAAVQLLAEPALPPAALPAGPLHDALRRACAAVADDAAAAAAALSRARLGSEPKAGTVANTGQAVCEADDAPAWTPSDPQAVMPVLSTTVQGRTKPLQMDVLGWGVSELSGSDTAQVGDASVLNEHAVRTSDEPQQVQRDAHAQAGGVTADSASQPAAAAAPVDDAPADGDAAVHDGLAAAAAAAAVRQTAMDAAAACELPSAAAVEGDGTVLHTDMGATVCARTDTGRHADVSASDPAPEHLTLSDTEPVVCAHAADEPAPHHPTPPAATLAAADTGGSAFACPVAHTEATETLPPQQPTVKGPQPGTDIARPPSHAPDTLPQAPNAPDTTQRASHTAHTIQQTSDAPDTAMLPRAAVSDHVSVVTVYVRLAGGVPDVLTSMATARHRLIKKLHQVPKHLMEVDTEILSSGPLDVSACERSIERLQDQIRQREPTVAGTEGNDVAATAATPQQTALMQVYTAVLTLTRAASLLVEYGLTVAQVYMSHMCDTLPNIAPMITSAATTLATAHTALRTPTPPSQQETTSDTMCDEPDLMCEGVCDPVCDESDLLRAQADTWLRQGGVVEDDEARLLWPSEEAVDHPKLRVLQALLLAVGRQTPGSKVMVVGDSRVFFLLYKAVVGAGLQPHHFDRHGDLLHTFHDTSDLTQATAEPLQDQHVSPARGLHDCAAAAAAAVPVNTAAAGTPQGQPSDAHHRLTACVQDTIQGCDCLLVDEYYASHPCFPTHLFSAVVHWSDGGDEVHVPVGQGQGAPQVVVLRTLLPGEPAPVLPAPPVPAAAPAVAAAEADVSAGTNMDTDTAGVPMEGTGGPEQVMSAVPAAAAAAYPATAAAVASTADAASTPCAEAQQADDQSIAVVPSSTPVQATAGRELSDGAGTFVPAGKRPHADDTLVAASPMHVRPAKRQAVSARAVPVGTQPRGGAEGAGARQFAMFTVAGGKTAQAAAAASSAAQTVADTTDEPVSSQDDEPIVIIESHRTGTVANTAAEVADVPHADPGNKTGLVQRVAGVAPAGPAARTACENAPCVPFAASPAVHGEVAGHADVGEPEQACGVASAVAAQELTAAAPAAAQVAAIDTSARAPAASDTHAAGSQGGVASAASAPAAELPEVGAAAVPPQERSDTAHTQLLASQPASQPAVGVSAAPRQVVPCATIRLVIDPADAPAAVTSAHAAPACPEEPRPTEPDPTPLAHSDGAAAAAGTAASAEAAAPCRPPLKRQVVFSSAPGSLLSQREELYECLLASLEQRGIPIPTTTPAHTLGMPCVTAPDKQCQPRGAAQSGRAAQGAPIAAQRASAGLSQGQHGVPVTDGQREDSGARRQDRGQGSVSVTDGQREGADGAQGQGRSQDSMSDSAVVDIEVVERTLHLVDLVLAPTTCLCLWPIVRPVGQGQPPAHELAQTVASEVLCRVQALAMAYSQVFIILEASDGLQAALSTHMTALYTQLASLPSTRVQLLTSATPHKTQALALQLCAAALQNTGFVRLSTPGLTTDQATALYPCMPLGESPSPAEHFLTTVPMLNTLSAAVLLSLRLPLGQLLRAAADGMLPQLADAAVAGGRVAGYSSAASHPANNHTRTGHATAAPHMQPGQGMSAGADGGGDGQRAAALPSGWLTRCVAQQSLQLLQAHVTASHIAVSVDEDSDTADVKPQPQLPRLRLPTLQTDTARVDSRKAAEQGTAPMGHVGHVLTVRVGDGQAMLHVPGADLCTVESPVCSEPQGLTGHAQRGAQHVAAHEHAAGLQHASGQYQYAALDEDTLPWGHAAGPREGCSSSGRVAADWRMPPLPVSPPAAGKRGRSVSPVLPRVCRAGTAAPRSPVVCPSPLQPPKPARASAWAAGARAPAPAMLLPRASKGGQGQPPAADAFGGLSARLGQSGMQSTPMRHPTAASSKRAAAAGDWPDAQDRTVRPRLENEGDTDMDIDISLPDLEFDPAPASLAGTAYTAAVAQRQGQLLARPAHGMAGSRHTQHGALVKDQVDFGVDPWELSPVASTRRPRATRAVSHVSAASGVRGGAGGGGGGWGQEEAPLVLDDYQVSLSDADDAEGPQPALPRSQPPAAQGPQYQQQRVSQRGQMQQDWQQRQGVGAAVPASPDSLGDVDFGLGPHGYMGMDEGMYATQQLQQQQQQERLVAGAVSPPVPMLSSGQCRQPGSQPAPMPWRTQQEYTAVDAARAQQPSRIAARGAIRGAPGAVGQGRGFLATLNQGLAQAGREQGAGGAAAGAPYAHAAAPAPQRPAQQMGAFLSSFAYGGNRGGGRGGDRGGGYWRGGGRGDEASKGFGGYRRGKWRKR